MHVASLRNFLVIIGLLESYFPLSKQAFIYKFCVGGAN